MEINFERNTFTKRLTSMLRVDFRRMFTMPLLYIFLLSSIAMPVLILVMTTMMDGTVSVNPQTGVETVTEGFDNVWQIIGTVSSSSAVNAGASDAAAAMSLTSMCNMNMMYFIISVLVCIFVADDFRSGYSKNLFTVRAEKSDYVISKTLVCFAGGALMLFAFFIGSLLGGAISGLPFTMDGFNSFNLVACVLSKIILAGVFVPIYLTMSVIAKQRLWLSVLLSLGVGMLLYMMIPMLTPLDSGFGNPVICLIATVLLSAGLGSVSNIILKKTALV